MTYLTPSRDALAKALDEHRYRDLLGDYEVAPYYKHFGCSCGWELNIAGMSGWRSWVAAHDAHVADALIASGAVIDAATLADDEALALELAESIWEDEPTTAELDLIRQALRNLPDALAARGESR